MADLNTFRTLKFDFIVVNCMQLRIGGLITKPVTLNFNNLFVSLLKHTDASCNYVYYSRTCLLKNSLMGMFVCLTWQLSMSGDDRFLSV